MDTCDFKMDSVNTAIADISLTEAPNPSGDPFASASNLCLYALARLNLYLISKKVKAVSLPNILTLYYNPALAFILSVFNNLQLPTLFKK
jgi:hypothetical protein